MRRENFRLLLVKVWQTGQNVIGCWCKLSGVVIVEIVEEPWRGLAPSKNDPHDGFCKVFGQASIIDDRFWFPQRDEGAAV